MADDDEAAENEELRKKASSDLRFMLSRNDVGEPFQLKLYRQKVLTVQKFSSFFRSEDDLIAVLAASFDLDATASLEQRAQVAAVMVSWRESRLEEAAGSRSRDEHKGLGQANPDIGLHHAAEQLPGCAREY